MCGEWTSRDETIKRRWLDPGAIYALADGHALYLYGGSWTMIGLAFHFSHPRWRAALASAPRRLCEWEAPEPVARTGGRALPGATVSR